MLCKIYIFLVFGMRIMQKVQGENRICLTKLSQKTKIGSVILKNVALEMRKNYQYCQNFS